ncbi:alanine racemase [Campylobacter sp. FMV-PI01]|uniref:Alanine racemase n=1 Tax=Campylobacter portucalensis TaxID=2608384 RepID=A0A6L5WJ72_9BACT|nr:alanine racemase [Campylobacter portucalensis]MSN96065.1 alanine racemase [Campylobacter portucalensis]
MENIYTLINLDNFEHNFKNIKSLLNDGVKFCGVVKADAYGHGSVMISKFYEKLGADYLAVSRLNEGVELRKNGIKLPILLLGFCENIKACLKYNLELPIYNLEMAKVANKIAKKNSKILKIHIAIDTGMSRIGFLLDDILKTKDEILEISKLSNLEILGIFSHFSNSDSSDHKFTNLQNEKFTQIINLLEQNSLFINLKHISNSAATINFKNFQFNMVRVGLANYGYYPSNHTRHKLNLKPVMSLKAKIINIKILPKDKFISYSLTYKTKNLEKIATVNIGYADGFARIQNSPEILIKGVKCPVVGRICMDQCMVKIPLNMDVKIGEFATIFDENLTADEVAKRSNTISYEVLCSMQRRIPRVYVKNDKIIEKINYLDI